MTQDYDSFIAKFKPKKHKMTSDDCYTPKAIMDVVNRYVADRWDLDPKNFVRPFYPGGEYKSFKYLEGNVVVDNPPFSILDEILRFYAKNGINFFLFTQGLTSFSYLIDKTFDVIVPGLKITYENGAIINTCFITNLPTPFSVETAVDLYKELKIANKKNNKPKCFPKYIYPDHVLRSADIEKFSKSGVDYKVKKGHCRIIRRLESQKQAKKKIFGDGLLLSSEAAAGKAAAERTAAEKTNVTKWELSEKELKIIKELDESA